MCEGKGDLFIRKWEAIIIPQLMDVAVKEKSEIASLTEGMNDLTDGTLSDIFSILTCWISESSLSDVFKNVEFLFCF